MIGPKELLLAFFLDFAIGDPAWLPHPVRMIGSAIMRIEALLRAFCKSAAAEKTAGALLVLITVSCSSGIAAAIQQGVRLLPHKYHLLGTILIVYLAATTIAVHELVKCAKQVIDTVKGGDLVAARRELSMIVGRDTEKLSDQEVLKAVTETLAENLSDGVIAPLFYLALGGLPLAIAYKAINTLDSMVGYKNERYRNFGWVAAKLDDVANFIPARITGFIVVPAVFVVELLRKGKALASARAAFRIMRRDGRNHSSPNSGVPEAAMAGGLGVRMGGPSTYGGVLVEKPFIGDSLRSDYLAASEEALLVVQAASLIGLAMCALILAARSPLA